MVKENLKNKIEKEKKPHPQVDTKQNDEHRVVLVSIRCLKISE